MALKVSGTTVIDDSKNIPSGTPSVQGTIVTATVLTAPSGTTAQRPASPNTGHIFLILMKVSLWLTTELNGLNSR